MLSPFAFMFGMLGFAVAILCLKDLQETKKILLNYVNDDDKKVLLTKLKLGKWHYLFTVLYMVLMAVMIGYFVYN